jgi:hypothetical protein
MICASCRVEVAKSARLGWVHTEPVPEGFKLDHEIVAADPEEIEELTAEYVELDGAKARVAKLRQQMAEMPGVAFTEVAKDAITLLAGIEDLERELGLVYE